MKPVPPSRYVVFFTLASLGCLLDLVTKEWIFDRLGLPREQEIWWLWNDVLGFQTSLNEGALFGIGQGRVSFFSVMSVVAAIAIFVWLFVARAARDWLVTIASGLICAGILGNLYDRLGLPGLRWNYANPPLHEIGEPVYAVRDWILVMIGSWPWPTFNLADSMLVTGAGLIIVHVIWFDASTSRRTDDASESGEDLPR
ncbi:MAG: signal peptidase II [Thermoguttaceae bacterium]